jgi:hypothetical protein
MNSQLKQATNACLLTGLDKSINFIIVINIELATVKRMIPPIMTMEPMILSKLLTIDVSP